MMQILSVCKLNKGEVVPSWTVMGFTQGVSVLQSKWAMLTQKSSHHTLSCTMDGETGPLRNAVWLLLCQQMAEGRSYPALCMDPIKQLQTWFERAAWEQKLIPLIEKQPPPTHPPSQLSSINSFHAGQQPGILHIPQPSYLKFISNNCSLKGNVCELHAAVIIELRIDVCNGWSLKWVCRVQE